MGRRLRTKLPIKPELLKPKLVKGVSAQFQKLQAKAKSYYDQHAKPLAELSPGDSVRYQKGKIWIPAVIVRKHESPRSYIIRTESAESHR